jgi:hypothetical protein
LFEKELLKLRAEAAHIIAEKINTVYDGCVSMEQAVIARGKSDNYKWMAAKKMPSVFGDKIDINVNHTVDITKALDAAQNRAMPFIEMKQAIQPQGSSEDRSSNAVLERSVKDTSETE